jgi:hypothetical protein
MAPTLLRRRGNKRRPLLTCPRKLLQCECQAREKKCGETGLCRLRGPLGDYSVARCCAPRVLALGGPPVGSREQDPFRRTLYTPYWTTFELTAIDMKAASVGILDQVVAGLR